MALGNGLDISLSVESGLNEDGFLDDDLLVTSKEFKCICRTAVETENYINSLIRKGCSVSIISQTCIFDLNLSEFPLVVTSFCLTS